MVVRAKVASRLMRQCGLLLLWSVAQSFREKSSNIFCYLNLILHLHSLQDDILTISSEAFQTNVYSVNVFLVYLS